MKIVKLYYRVQDGGDGSVSVRFFKDKQDAIDDEEHDIEEGGNGWGESSVSSVTLELDENFEIKNKTYHEVYPDWYNEDEPNFNQLNV